jgi:hypothetical protein
MEAMNVSRSSDRYRAVSMELVADLEARNVEMRILTDAGKTIAVICPRNSIFAVRRHIEKIGAACPEIATWSEDCSGQNNSAEAMSGPIQRERSKGSGS